MIGIISIMVLVLFVGYKRWMNNDPVAIQINPGTETSSTYQLDAVIGVRENSSHRAYLQLTNGNESKSFYEYHLLNRDLKEIDYELYSSTDFNHILLYLD